MKKIKIIGSVIIIVLVAYFISVVVRAVIESNEDNSKTADVSYESSIEEYADVFKGQYSGIMEEFSNYENGDIDITELIRQLRGYSDGVELRIDTMKRDLPESDARNELETIAWNLRYSADHIADYISGDGNDRDLEDGLNLAQNFVDLMNEFEETYLS